MKIKKLLIKMEKKESSITIEDIYTLFKNGLLGIPHFQRGLVWDEPQVEMLFESLYHGYPIGSIVLWNLDDKEKENYVQQLNPKKKVDDVNFAIIDGQQRIRTICEELAPLFDENEQNNADGTIWCFDLFRAYLIDENEPSIFDKKLEKRKKSSLIKKIAAPNVMLIPFRDKLTEYKDKKREHKPNEPTYLRYMVPLEYLSNIEKNDDKIFLNYIKKLQYEIKKLQHDDLKKKNDDKIKQYFKKKEIISKFKKQTVFVNIESKKDFAKVINIYNQINSGGLKVENEELAYSKLILLEEKLGGKNLIKEIFDEVHEEDDKGKVGINYYLNRQRENQFGFKFYIRVFIMVANYHFGYSQGKSSFNFDFINNDGFSEIINKNKKGKKVNRLNDLWKRTQIIIFALHKLLKDHLFCDDYRFLPSTVSLYPIIQLLIQYPKLIDIIKNDENNDKNIPKEAETKTLCRLILQFQFAGFSTKEILNVVYSINQRRYSFEKTIKLIDNKLLLNNKKDEAIYVKNYRGEWEFGKKAVWKYAKSVTHRYVQLMYWLQRELEAMDFNYKKNNFPNETNFEEAFKKEYNEMDCDKKYYDKGLPLEKRFNPQREHLIPYSKLKEILNIGVGSRVSTHEANDIGNLTFISSLLNSMYHGKSDKIMNIDNNDTLSAHFLETEDLKKYAANSDTYKKFINNRQKLIRKGFQKWIYDLMVETELDESIDYEIQQYHEAFLKLKGSVEESLADLIWRAYHNCKTGNLTNGFKYHFKLRKDKNRFLILFKDNTKTKNNIDINFCLYENDKSIALEYYDEKDDPKVIYKNNVNKIEEILSHLINKDIKKDNVLEELIDCINENIDEADKKIPIFK